MAYVAVTGGSEAINSAEKLVQYFRVKEETVPIEVEQIKAQMRLAVDKVMSEGGLYSPTIAAVALKQAEGDAGEAAFITRAYRSTQPRRYSSLTIDTRDMTVIRRISGAFQDMPGGQLLGPTRDYTQRLVDFSLLTESPSIIKQFLADLNIGNTADHIPDSYAKIIDLLRAEGLLVEPAHRAGRVVDVTMEPLSFPCPRSAKLQVLARGETGAMMAIAYSSVRGYGDIHPYLGELRVGYVPVRMLHEATGREVYIGKVLVTEAEIIAKYAESDNQAKPQLTLGYGLCFGHNEVKALSMGILDRTLETKAANKAPAEDEEFVLYHIDGIEASGFVAHLKMPHYVTFQSVLDRLRKSQKLSEEAKSND